MADGVFCYAKECVHNKDGRCKKTLVVIRKSTCIEPSFGNDIVHPVCGEFERIEKDGRT